VKRLETIDHVMESPSGKALWKIVSGVMAAIITALLALILAGINTTNTIAQSARDNNYRQDQSIALLQAQTTSLQRVSDATVTSLQAMSLQMTKNSDQLEQLNDAQKALIQRTRPPR
jgi:hypothetical protein